MDRARTMRLVTAVAAVLLATGCSTVSVDTDWDPRVDFGGFDSYAWLPGPQPETGDVRIDNPLLDQRVRKAIDAQLAAQGHRKVAPDQASFLVGYHLSTEKKLRATTVNSYYGYGYGTWGYWGGPGPAGGSQTMVTEYETGTLIIDVVDRSRNELVWRGSGEKRIGKERTPEESEKVVAEVVAAILERFPPGK